MNIRRIKTEADHDAALDRLGQLWDAEPGSAEDDELGVLVLLIDDYEARQHPIDPPDPIEAILFRMDQMGWTRKDLEALIGGRGRISEVLSRNRPLTLPMIRRIHEAMKIPAEVLIRQ